MAISTPGDIVLDVVRAADPAAAEAARAKLASFAGKAPGVEFSASGSPSPAGAPSGSATAETFRKFEAVVLQTFVQTMLPKETEAVYGQGMAGEMWQSLLAEQLANAMAARGGIGIADRILRDHYQAEENASLDPTRHDAAADLSERDAQEMLSVALVQEIQRRTAQSLNEDRAAVTPTTGR